MSYKKAKQELQHVLNNQKTVSVPKLKRLLETLNFSLDTEIEKGKRITSTVEILKVKKGDPTKIHFNGNDYALLHKDYINGHKNKFGRKKNAADRNSKSN